MSQPSDRGPSDRRPGGRPMGRPQRRFDGPAGRGPRRGPASGAPANRPFGRPARPPLGRREADGERDGRFPAERPGEGRRERPERGERQPFQQRGSWERGAAAPREGRRGPGGPGERFPFPPRPSFPARGPEDRGGRPRFAGDRRPAGRPSFQPGRGAERRGPGERQRPFHGAERGPSPAVAALQEAAEASHFAAAAPSDLIWGRHTAQAALESGRPIHRIWCTPEMRFSSRFLQLLREAKASGVLVEEVSWARLGQISGGAVHQGIVLQPAAAETLDLNDLIEGCRGLGEAPLLLAVDGLTDPQNLGAIVRSAEALGAHGLVLPQRRNAGLTGSVAKVAAGALEHLPVARVVNLNRSLETLRQEGYRVIGLAGEGNVTLEEADLSGPLVVVTGSEADGLALLTRRSCDQLVRIPLRGATPSLNASVATAMVLYEVARRSWMKGLNGAAPAPRIMRPALPAPAMASAPEEAGGDVVMSSAAAGPVPHGNGSPEQVPEADGTRPQPPAAAPAAIAAEPSPAAAAGASGPSGRSDRSGPFDSDPAGAAGPAPAGGGEAWIAAVDAAPAPEPAWQQRPASAAAEESPEVGGEGDAPRSGAALTDASAEAVRGVQEAPDRDVPEDATATPEPENPTRFDADIRL